MRERNIFLTLCLCLLSTFTLADSPTDAPLTNSDSTPVVNQRDTGKKRKCEDRKAESQLVKGHKHVETSQRDAYAEKGSAVSFTEPEVREKNLPW